MTRRLTQLNQAAFRFGEPVFGLLKHLSIYLLSSSNSVEVGVSAFADLPLRALICMSMLIDYGPIRCALADKTLLF